MALVTGWRHNHNRLQKGTHTYLASWSPVMSQRQSVEERPSLQQAVPELHTLVFAPVVCLPRTLRQRAVTGLEPRHVFLTVWRVDIQDQDSRKVGFLLGPAFWACTRPPSHGTVPHGLPGVCVGSEHTPV